MIKFKKYLYLLLLLNYFYAGQAQPTNPQTGDGFWTQVSTMRMNQIIWINDTLYSSRNPLYQSNGGVYRSIDGGTNWDTLYSVSDVLSSGLRLFIHPTNHNILYLIYGALYRSTNSGQSWSLLFNPLGLGPLVRLGINPKNPNVMYVTKSIPYGAVFKTTDAGFNWSDASIGLPSEEYFQAGPIEVNPAYPDTLLLGTNTGLYRSTNAGINWDTTVVKGFITGININPFFTIEAFTSTLDDFASYRTENFGKDWDRINDNSGASKFIFNAIYNGIIYSNTNRKSTDGGINWLRIDTTYNSWSDLEIDYQANSNLIATAGSYGLYRYTDLISSVNQESETAINYLLKTYPNPFNSCTNVKVIIHRQTMLSIIIYNSLGQKIKTLANRIELYPGTYNYVWYAKDDFQSSVASGVYYCQIFIENNQQKEYQTLKLILLK
ncbi:MAG TPA: hypothetical protein PKE38_08365 [Ignavibacteriaceae bacterium]|nr:hypothetical protein [Ignavibacteriaceae bacterium]